jgi:hypothetical protein
MTDLDLFCIYCQVEFPRPASLARHIHNQHPGTYAAESHPLPTPCDCACHRLNSKRIAADCSCDARVNGAVTDGGAA